MSETKIDEKTYDRLQALDDAVEVERIDLIDASLVTGQSDDLYGLERRQLLAAGDRNGVDRNLDLDRIVCGDRSGADLGRARGGLRDRLGREGVLSSGL